MTTVNFAKRKVSRAAATLLTVVLTMTATTAWADPTFLTRGDGQGTEADPYKITSASDLRDLTVYVNGSGTYSNSTTESTNHSCDDVYFLQTTDINLSGPSFQPIGDNAVNNRSFCGHYDGGNNSITNLHVEGDYRHAGLFGRLVMATVTNVRLVSPTVISTSTQEECYAGALVGSTQINNNEAYRSTIENCQVINPTVYFNTPGSQRWAGAIIGSTGGVYDRVSYCYFYDSNGHHGYAAIGDTDPSGTIVNTSVTRHITLGANVTTTTPASNRDNGFVYDGEHYYRQGLELVLGTTLEEDQANGYFVAYSSDDGSNWSLSNVYTVSGAYEGKMFTASNDKINYEFLNAGNVGDPYLIKNKDQMAILAQRVNSGVNYNGKYFRLDTPLYYDYTMANLYTPIGTAEHPFSGFFDGNSQEIAYVVLNQPASCQGLFGHTDGATIKNVLVHDSKFTGTDQLGAVVGRAENSTMTDCTVYDTEVTATSATGNAGAIVGSSTSNTFAGNYYYNTSRKKGDADAESDHIGTAGGDVSGISPLRRITLADGISTTTPATDRANGYVVEGKTCFRDGLLLTLEPLAAIEGYIGSYYLGGVAFAGNTLTVDAGCEGKTITKAYTAHKTPRDVTYMKADGTTATHAAIPLDGSETTLTTGWYYVGSDISFDHAITTGYKSDVTIVLANGKTMQSYHFIREENENYDDDGVFTIYGQSLDPDEAGTLSVTSLDGKTDAIIVPQYVQHSGNVIINNATGYGIFCYIDVTVNGGKLNITLENNIPVVAAGNIVINGGQVSAQGLNNGLGFRTYGGHDIVLGWTNTTDYIYSTCYEMWGDGGQLRIADGRAFTDGTTLFTNDNVTADALKDKTLRPAAVVTFDNSFGVTLHTVAVILGDVVAQPEAPTLAGATFEGWYSADNIGPGGTAYDFSAPVNNSLTLYAKWSGIDYNIGYDLTGGELPAGQSNPTAYNSSSADITLVNPVRKGYTFAGWTGTGLTAPTTSVTIAAGSMASRQYTATWTPIDYTITYDLAGGELPAGLSNPTTFNIESDDITLVNPTRAHYDFAGWTGSFLDEATEDVVIAKGSTENRTYTATWTALKDFTKCTVTVPNPTYNDGYYIGYNFENGNGGIVVKDPDGNQLSDTDYSYAGVVSLDYDAYNDPCTHENEHCQVIIEGCGLWEGSVAVDIVILPKSGSVTVSLSDTGDNSGLISALQSVPSANITLQGRTLWKDGAWNTLCLPFDVVLAGSPLEGADARELIPATSGVEGSTLTLNFTAENEVTELVAGTPYLIKWVSGENITNPMFSDVTIKNAPTEVPFTGGKFVGIYSPVCWTEENKSILYLGAENKLYWPQPAGNPVSLNAFRAYFQLADGQQASAFELNFDGEGETTKIERPTPGPSLNGGEWYDLSGRKLNSKPTAKGIYIRNGVKVVIK